MADRSQIPASFEEETARPIWVDSSHRIAAEGDDGLFRQSWYPICLSSDVGAGEVRGEDFLGGRVAVYRTEAGEIRIMSAFCPHVGADLAVGTVVEDRLRCAFHLWEYDASGRCVKTAVGDPPPPTARLFAFPTRERFGIVWAFNGTEPLFELPDFDLPDNDLHLRTVRTGFALPVDPWEQCCQTPDFQHLRALHNIDFVGETPDDTVTYGPFHMKYHFRGRHPGGMEIDHKMAIHGVSMFHHEGVINDDSWFGVLLAMGLQGPKHSESIMVIAIPKTTPEDAREGTLDMIQAIEIGVIEEDLEVMRTMRMRPGTLSKSDKNFARFFKYLRQYPRAHPSRDYIM